MLHPGGLLVTGLSESLKIIDIENMDTLATSVYSFDKAEQEETQISSKSSPVKSEVSKLMAPSATKLPSPIKVLAVDDSKSVLKLLGKIFDMDKDFELVGTAENGLEAQEFLKTNKVDMMTLDIHMPEMDGVQYLEKNFGPSHPKVLVISSASREDTRYAQKTIELGASDFVEKPALNNIKEKAEEIKMKIKMSLMTAGRVKTSLDTSFKKDFTIKDCDQKARVFFANFSDLKKVSDSIKELKGDQPPICLVFEGNENYLDVIKSEMSKSGHYNVEVLSSETKEISKGRVYICDFKTQFDLVSGFVKNRLKNVSVFGVCSSSAVDKILGLDNFQLLVEDLGDMNKDLREVAHDVFPWTSFPHVGTEFLSGEDE
jgi:chemotaxis protein methyltransferase CheR